jgi:XTP/dITP diphosphohydrolase
MSGLVPPGFEVEESGSTFEENAWLKALEVSRVTKMPTLADDSGIEVDALGGRPGVYSARYAGLGAGDEANNQLLLQELHNVPAPKRTARFRCVLAFAAPGNSGPRQVALTAGAIEGRILSAPRGVNGFGYDPLFEPLDAPGRTTAELSPEAKNKISHRAEAARAMLPLLTQWLEQPDRVTL